VCRYQSFCPPPPLHQSNRPVISAAVQGRKIIILPLSGGVSNDYCTLSRPCAADHLSSAVRLSALSVRLTIFDEIAHVFSGNACLDNICS